MIEEGMLYYIILECLRENQNYSIILATATALL
jgi:hypothetical protein